MTYTHHQWLARANKKHCDLETPFSFDCLQPNGSFHPFAINVSKETINEECYTKLVAFNHMAVI